MDQKYRLDDEIAFAEHGVHVHQFDAKLGGLGLRHQRIACQKTAEAKRPGDAEEFARDIAASDRPQHAATDVAPQFRQVTAPFARARHAVEREHVLRKRERECQDGFSNRRANALGRYREYGIGLGQRGDVNPVITHTPPRHNGQALDTPQTLRSDVHGQVYDRVILVQRFRSTGVVRLRRHGARVDQGCIAEHFLDGPFEVALGICVEIWRDADAKLIFHAELGEPAMVTQRPCRWVRGLEECS